jgi:hypothetical protein
MELTHGNRASWLKVLWDALHDPCDPDDARWDDVCTAMAWVTEELGLDPLEVCDAD